MGPFKIIQVVSTHAVKLKLPRNLRLLHPVFHVSLLEPVKPDKIPKRRHDPPPPVVIEGEEQWAVSSILD